MLADTFAVAVALKVTPTVVRTWASRYPAELPRRGRKDGRTLFDLEDARRLQERLAEVCENPAMVIWRNEFHQPTAADTGAMADPPKGPIEITRVEKSCGNYKIWFAPAPAVDAATLRSAQAKVDTGP